MSSKKRIIGLQIASARHLLKLTQDELAEKSDVSSGKIKSMEKSKYKASGLVEYTDKVENCLLNQGIEFYEDNDKVGIMISKKKLKKMEDKEKRNKSL